MSLEKNMNRKIQQYIEKYEALGYGEDHLLFACHAAFPTGVTVHLLYQMWANFSMVPGRSQPMDPIVISDFLLSNLVRETSLGIFEMHARVRAELLDQLKADERFGEKRVEALAFFLYQYIQRSVQERDYDTFRETQYWTAMAVIAPQRAAKEIGKLLGNKIQAEDTGEILRLNRLLEQIGQEEKSFESILNYSRGLRDGLLERPTAAAESFNKVMVIGESDQDDSLSLKIPLMKSVISEQVQFRWVPGLSQRRAQELATDLIQKAIAEEQTFLRLSNIPFLEKIPDSIRAAIHLEQLYAEGSSLKVFPDLSGLPRLEMLHFTGNELTSVPASHLPPNLLMLALNNNGLHQLDGAVWQQETMQALLLKNNALKIMSPGFLQAGEQLLEVDLSENPWLNLPQPTEYRVALAAAREHWLSIPSGRSCIQLFGLGYQLGETLLDIRDQLTSWEEAEQIAVQNQLLTTRYGLYNYATSTDTSIQISYFGGADFTLAIDAEQSQTEPLLPTDFATLLANRSAFTNVVILNVPNSAPYAEALLDLGFQAVIAAPGNLSDIELFGFQERFFEHLSERQSIRTAFEEVLAELRDPEDIEDYIPNVEQIEADFGLGPGLSDELWEIHEKEGVNVNWDWRLPAQTAESSPTEDTDLEKWQEEQLDLLSGREVGPVLEALEPQIRMGTTPYHDLVVISNHAAFVQELSRRSAISSEEQERQRDTLRQYAANLIRNVQAADLRDSPSDKGPRENIITLKHSLYTYLRKNQWASLWAETDRQLKPTAINFERFFQEWKHQRIKNEWEADRIGLEDHLRFRSINVEALCSFIKGLSVDQQKREVSELGIDRTLEYFEYSVLRLLPKGDIQNILYYINDKLASIRGLSKQFKEWEGRLMELENDWSQSTIAFEDYINEYEKIIRQWGDFLQNNMSEELLRTDYLGYERQNLQDSIQRVQSQKALDFIAMNRLEAELQLLERLMQSSSGPMVDWVPVVACYKPIAENRLREACERLLEISNKSKHRLTPQFADLFERISLLERDRNNNMAYTEYRKERASLVDGIIVTLNDLLADAEVPEPMWRPELADYIRRQVDQWIKEGQLKEVLTYLRKILYPAGMTMQNVLELSASYYELEAAQNQEEQEYYAIMEELNRFERYLYDLLSGEYQLRNDFLDFERNRVELALKGLQSIGKSKKFDIRRDGTYQQLQQDLALLNKL